jgi:hypothetical protein
LYNLLPLRDAVLSFAGEQPDYPGSQSCRSIFLNLCTRNRLRLFFHVTGIGEPFHCAVVTSSTSLCGKPYNILKRAHPDPDLSEIAG